MLLTNSIGRVKGSHEGVPAVLPSTTSFLVIGACSRFFKTRKGPDTDRNPKLDLVSCLLRFSARNFIATPKGLCSGMGKALSPSSRDSTSSTMNRPTSFSLPDPTKTPFKD